MGMWTLRLQQTLATARPAQSRRLSKWQRLGERVEADLPHEALVRSLRTRAAAESGGDWVWPFWLERQLDPRSPAFVPSGPLAMLTNLTHRNWTMVGNVASPLRAIVDQRGLVTPWPQGWSLDWWIGADDRWRFPSREVSVRQWLVDRAPVVETAMRVPGGDAVHRAYAVAGTDGHGELLAVEIENRSALPFAVGLAVRPANPDGLALVERIAVHERLVVTVDGRPALVLPRAPPLAALGAFASGDVATRLHDPSRPARPGQLGELPGRGALPRPALPGPCALPGLSWLPETNPAVWCPAGLAHAVFVYPLAHGAMLRAVIPLRAGRRRRRRSAARRQAARLPEFPRSLAPAAAVARGWDLHARRGMRLVLPEGRLADTVEANRRALLLYHRGSQVTSTTFSSPGFRFNDAAGLLGALGRYGFHDEVADVLRTYPARQRFDGRFDGDGRWDANGGALVAVGDHWRLTRDPDLLAALLPAVALGARWIGRRCEADGERHRDPAGRGLMPPGRSEGGRRGHLYADSYWSVRGLLDAAELLSAGGNEHGAGLCRERAARLRADLDASLATVRERLGTQVMPAGPGRGIDAGIIGTLVACSPLGVLGPDNPSVAATVDAIRQGYCVGDAVFSPMVPSGLATAPTMQLASVELARREPIALQRLRWLVDSATSTYTWPEAVHPTLGSGCAGDGSDGRTSAAFLTFVRDLLVREVAQVGAPVGSRVGLALCSMLPESWAGESIEVHDAPTAAGRLSFAVRWHGPRPALLWELTPHDGVGPVRITAPGLDPAWTTEEVRGEALLVPGDVAADVSS